MTLRERVRQVTAHRFLRFLAVGVLNTAFGYTCFWLLLYAGLHYSVAILLGTIIGVLFNFKSTGAFVFGSHDNRRLARFFGTYAVIYCCNVVGVGLLVRTGMTPQVAGAVLVLPMALLSFTLNRKFVFTAT